MKMLERVGEAIRGPICEHPAVANCVHQVRAVEAARAALEAMREFDDDGAFFKLLERAALEQRRECPAQVGTAVWASAISAILTGEA
jgi:hypothetical protein